MNNDIESAIRTFIAENFLFTDDTSGLSTSESLLEADVLNSTGVLELVMFLEEHFEIKVEDSEVVPENLDSIGTMVTFIKAKLSAGAPIEKVA